MEKDMTKGRPLPVILKFMLPLIIGNIFQQLYNMADTIIVGRYVGADALAAVGSTGTIMFLTVGFSQGITAGFSVLTAQRFGAKDTEGVKISVANGILLSFCPCNGRTGTDHLSEAWVESAAGLSFLCNWNHEYDTSGIRSYRF